MRIFLGGWMVLAALLVGCGGGDPQLPALHPVTGVVTRGATPIKDALVRLESQPANTLLTITAPTDAEGKFALSTFNAKANDRQPGVPEGTYRVMVTLPMNPDQSGGGAYERPAPFVVNAGVNQLDIDVAVKK